MVASVWVRAALVVACVSAAAAIWVEPAVRGSLTAWASASGSQHAGAAVTYNCTADGMRDTQTIYWRHQRGNAAEDTWQRGSAPLVLLRAVRADDAGTALYCDALYTAASLAEPAGSLRSYRVQSNVIQLFVAGGIPTTPSPAVASRSVEVTFSAPLDSLRVGDQVTLGCRLTGVTSQWIDLFQVKDGVEMQLTAFRTWEVTAEDDGTQVYCQIWLSGEFIVSPRLTLTVWS